MLLKLKQMNKLDILFGVMMLAGLVFVLYYMFIGYEVGFNSDSATANLLAREQMLTKQFYPATWYYANELWTTTQNIPIIFLNFFSNNQLFNRACSILFQSILWFIILYFFNRKILKEKSTVLLFCVLLCGVSDYFLENMYGQAAYEINCIVVVLSILLGFYSLNDKCEINIKYLIALGAVAVSQLIGGTRYLIFFFAPFVAAVVFVFCMEHAKDDWKDIKKPICSIVFWVISLAAICLLALFAGKWIASQCHVMNGATGSMLFDPKDVSSIQQSFGTLIVGYLYLFGYMGNCPMMSFMGIVSMIKLIFAVLIVFVLPVLLTSKYKNETIAVRRLIVFYWVSSLIIALTLVFTTLNVTIASVRYMFTSVMIALILDCYYLYKYWLSQTFIPKFIATAGIVVFVILSLYQTKATWNDYDMVHAEHETVISELENRNLKRGFATYWNAYKYTVLSDFKVEIASVLEDGKTPFYWLASERYYLPNENLGDTFLMLTNEEYEAIGEDALKEFYGTEQEKVAIANYVVLIYDYDISVKYQELYPIAIQQ